LFNTKNMEIALDKVKRLNQLKLQFGELQNDRIGSLCCFYEFGQIEYGRGVEQPGVQDDYRKY